ncbi:hypothetical protein TSAR_015337 [Trichomalopsis sarcophagae]|uniref:Uncharacterized protein n=1 Tax=Trichomalopsis sarcophagae TaxID=543379 RepID=A0A232FA12_9HYME|nr:hypothetical protein TSAR_015337 [Trichomalopsis sarcophagae]
MIGEKVERSRDECEMSIASKVKRSLAGVEQGVVDDRHQDEGRWKRKRAEWAMMGMSPDEAQCACALSIFVESAEHSYAVTSSIDRKSIPGRGSHAPEENERDRKLALL